MLGRSTPAGTRIAETLAYLDFVKDEFPAMPEPWLQRKAQLRFADGAPNP